MNWEAIGAIGEMVGAIAVFLTLLFLAVQIRQSTKVNAENARLLKADMKNRSDNSISRWSEVLLTDPELNRVWNVGKTSTQGFDELDSSRFFFLARNYLGLHATSYYDFEAAYDDLAKQRVVEFLSQDLAANPGILEVWRRLKKTPFTNYGDFYEAVNTDLHQRGT